MNKDRMIGGAKMLATIIIAASLGINAMQIKTHGLRSVLACVEQRPVTLPKMDSNNYPVREAVVYDTHAATEMVDALPPLHVNEQPQFNKFGDRVK